MDALSEALNAVHMTGAIFYHADCTAPWGFVVPPLAQVAHQLAPGTERLVAYHLVTEGTAMVRFDDGAEVAVDAGDVLIIPHGEGHTVSNGTPSRLVDSAASLGKFLAGDLKRMQLGGGGPATRFVCGYFGCERHAGKLFLAGLPQMIRINLRDDPTGAWLESTVGYLVAADDGSPGRQALLSKLAEALFIETLRRHMMRLPPEHTGWLAGARDPVVGAALARMHRAPCDPWTIAALAKGAGASRSVLIARFTRFLGEPPLTYLARWRLQLAARLLRGSRKSVIEVALDVGYGSEAAFSRAFRREFGLPPAQYRRAVDTREGGREAGAATSGVRPSTA